MDIKIKTAFILISTFLLGIIIGLIGDRTLIKMRFDRRPPEISSQMFVERTVALLELTDEQRQTVMPILDAYAKKMIATHEKSRLEFEVLMDSLFNELKAALPPDQQEKLESRRSALFMPPRRSP